MQERKKADIWISTVIYIFISIAIITALLLAARPKIEEARDRLTIQYMINAFNSIDSLIKEVNEIPGTARNFEMKISKGTMHIIPQQDRIEWSITTDFEFSEPGKEIQVGRVYINTTKTQRISTKIFLNYTTPINITTNANDEGNNITLTQSPNIYKIQIQNLGTPADSVNNTIFISTI